MRIDGNGSVVEWPPISIDRTLELLEAFVAVVLAVRDFLAPTICTFIVRVGFYNVVVSIERCEQRDGTRTKYRRINNF
jgi:hypothetical protein